MATKQVTVTARIKVKKGMEEILKQELQPIVDLTRSEEGCINYDLHQAADDQSLFMLHENWVSQEILDQHLELPHIKALGEKAKDILAEPLEVTVWQQII